MGNDNNRRERRAHVTLTLLILFLSNQLLELLPFVLHLSFPTFSLILTDKRGKHTDEGHLEILQRKNKSATVALKKTTTQL